MIGIVMNRFRVQKLGIFFKFDRKSLATHILRKINLGKLSAKKMMICVNTTLYGQKWASFIF